MAASHSRTVRAPRLLRELPGTRASHARYVTASSALATLWDAPRSRLLRARFSSASFKYQAQGKCRCIPTCVSS